MSSTPTGKLASSPPSCAHRCIPGVGYRTRRAVLVACGSFNPVTFLHLRMMEEAREYVQHYIPNTHVIGGFLSPVNDAYAKQGLVSASHRIAMCQAATADSDWIDVDRWEAEEPTFTRTYSVLHHVREVLRDPACVPPGVLSTSDDPVEVMLVLGSDVLETMTNEDIWDAIPLAKLLDEFSLLVMEREGEGTRDRGMLLKSNLLFRHASSIHFVPQIIVNNVSSSLVRRYLGLCLSVKYFIPDTVLHYIKEHRLYEARPPVSVDKTSAPPHCDPASSIRG